MRILVALDYYYPHWTGLSAYAKRLAEGMAARGHAVTVLTARHEPDLPAQEIINNVRIVRLPTLVRFSRGVIMPSFPIIAAQLIAAHDIVHVHTPMPEAFLVTGLARMLGKPSLVTHQGDVVMPAGFFNALVQKGTFILSLGLSFATRVVVHSADYGRHSAFLAPFAHKLDAIYPPVELPAPQPDAVAAKRCQLGLTGKPVIGFAGRFVEEKGFDILLQAMPLIRERLPDAHLVFAGEIDVVYEDFYARCLPLVQQQADHLTMLGLLRDRQELANFYAMCDVFVLPSRTDCFPSVQLEALLSGTPLVTTNIPGAREVLQVTGMGELVEACNPAALADGIVTVIRHRSQYQPTRAMVERTFSLQASVGAYEDLMKRLVRD